ncbi:MAG: hypothetical protein QNJ53_14705 [Pleurocapsa sp. MO_192.B19]|nr:hypothetical protein [Pleurocapsa sp. MO_192.B19]
MIESKKDSTGELAQVSVPTKKVCLTITETEKIEVILRPFKQKHFAVAIALINKYFDSYTSVNTDYVNRRRAILDTYKDAELRAEALLTLEETFKPDLEIAKAIFRRNAEGMSEDVKTIIYFSIYKATKIVELENSTERTPVEVDLDDFTWGECLVLLGSSIGLNMDFFAQNAEAMNLQAITNPEEAAPKPKAKAGAKSLAA